MSRVFTIPTVLRMVPNPLLKQFLERLGHAGLGIPWEELAKRDIPPILAAIETLTTKQFDIVEGELRTIFDLACETGVAAILEAGDLANDSSLREEMPPEANLYERAMWAWLNRRGVIGQATRIHQVEHLNWWRRRDDLPRAEPDRSPETSSRLAAELSRLLLAEQGRGRICTVETLVRRDTVYFFASPDDYVQNVTAHDETGQLASRTFRPTFSIVFAFCPTEGSLELFAKLPPRLKPLVEVIFARHVLGSELGEWRPAATYELNGLKDPRFILATDPEDHVIIHVRQLRLSLKNSFRQITLKSDPNWADDMHRMIHEVLDQERVPLSAVNVTLATFCFEFAPRDGTRAGSVTFDVAFPNHCGLRNQPEDRVEIITKYLRRWGIHVARPTPPNYAQAG